MLYSLAFALLLLAVVLLKYFWRPPETCPQCGERRGEDAPLCSECGWIYEGPDDDDGDDDDDGGAEEDEVLRY